MILYSVTVSVERADEAGWLAWMKDTHLPEVMETGCFGGYRLARVMVDQGPETRTYNITYEAATMADYDRYRTEHAPTMQGRTRERYGDRLIAFRTVLEVVD